MTLFPFAQASRITVLGAALALAGCAGHSAVDRLRASDPLAMIETQAEYHAVNACIVDHFVRRDMVPVVNVMEAERRATITVFDRHRTGRRTVEERPKFEVTTIAAAPTASRTTLRGEPTIFGEGTEAVRLRRDLQACGFATASL
ncbi:hypothetical protein [Falsiroseomonas ponticola]|uniref:hypothetical protein n=1 Tax=Falsiroseomonas ponticola TaxID=2786951 RepID=UPI0019349801|nr:hypothetical protein [Roseomonas ponticola]